MIEFGNCIINPVQITHITQEITKLNNDNYRFITHIYFTDDRYHSWWIDGIEVPNHIRNEGTKHIREWILQNEESATKLWNCMKTISQSTHYDGFREGLVLNKIKRKITYDSHYRKNRY
jgi:hypothetical protein